MTSLTEERVLQPASRLMSPAFDTDRPHGQQMLSQWQSLVRARSQSHPIQLSGSSLGVPSFIAVSRYVVNSTVSHPSLLLTSHIRYGTKASLDALSEEVARKIDDSVKFLREELARGNSVYGKSFLSL